MNNFVKSVMSDGRWPSGAGSRWARNSGYRSVAVPTTASDGQALSMTAMISLCSFLGLGAYFLIARRAGQRRGSPALMLMLHTNRTCGAGALVAVHRRVTDVAQNPIPEILL